MINFNVPPFVGKEEKYISEAIREYRKLCGDGNFTKKCNEWFQSKFSTPKALLTTSCTHALEMAAILCDIKPGDEVIAPSYTFVSTVNAFVLRGAKIVFVDIRPDTMNIDERLIEDAITEKTKVIIPVHYAGISCEMDKIMKIAKKYNLYVVEDAAQGVMASYKGQPLGTIGDFGCYSFHETKNYSMGEGGAILIQNKDFIERAEIIREKGTDRSRFFRGQVDKYSWVDVGSSFLPSELNAAYLYAQLEEADNINEDRLNSWNLYYTGLKDLENKGVIELPYIPKECKHNAHMFYIKVKDLEERTKLINYLKDRNISSVFHYVPLHSSKAGLEFGRFHGEDKYTTRESERLLRLPLYYGLDKSKVEYIIDKINDFFIK
ncbi:dTDP-4-amino-4,6-dideoxygalactose transaminase [Clostridium sp. MB05]